MITYDSVEEKIKTEEYMFSCAYNRVINDDNLTDEQIKILSWHMYMLELMALALPFVKVVYK